MTLILIFTFIVAISIICTMKIDSYKHENLIVVAGFGVMFGSILLLISILCYIPSIKDSEIDFNKALSARQTIEAAMKSSQVLDRVNLSESIIKFNNDIISNQANSKKFIVKDYYSKSAKWDSLKLIEFDK